MANRRYSVLKFNKTILLVISLALLLVVFPAAIEAFSLINPVSGSIVKSAKLSVNGRVDEPGKVIVDLGIKGDLSLKLSSKSLELTQSQDFAIDFFPEELRANPGDVLNLWLIAQFLPEDKSRIPPFPIFREFTWEIIGALSQLPTIAVSVTPASIVRGATATLSWSSTNTTSIIVAPSIGISPLPLSGSATVSPTTTTTYVFTATGPGGTTEARVTLTVTEPTPLPTITASVAPASIVRGNSATLSWSSTNATSITVTPSIGISPLPLSGTATVSPTSTTTYIFTATGPGGTAESRITLTVTEPPPPPPPLYRTVELRIGSTIYKVDGVVNTMDAAPYIEEGRTMVPVRFLVEGLGGTVGWDNNTKTVTVRFTKPTVEIKLIIGNPTATVNGIKVPIDPNNTKVVPVIKNNRTFVPLRFLVEQITGSSIDWVPADTVIMKLPR